MSTTARPQRIRQSLAAAVVLLLLLACWLFLRSTPPAAPAPPASLEIINPMARSWTVRTTSARDGGTAHYQIGPGETRQIELREGTYAFDQTLLASDGEPPHSRRIHSAFKAGEQYRWTLLALPRPELEEEP